MGGRERETKQVMLFVILLVLLWLFSLILLRWDVSFNYQEGDESRES